MGGETATAAAFCMSPQFINNGDGYNIREGESNDVGSDVGSDVGNDAGAVWRAVTRWRAREVTSLADGGSWCLCRWLKAARREGIFTYGATLQPSMEPVDGLIEAPERTNIKG